MLQTYYPLYNLLIIININIFTQFPNLYMRTINPILQPQIQIQYTIHIPFIDYKFGRIELYLEIYFYGSGMGLLGCVEDEVMFVFC